MALSYTQLTSAVKLRVATHPDVTSEWCGYNPNTYTVPVFLKGIYRDIYMGVVTELKAQVVEPWLAEFLEEDPEAFLGDAFRHIEVGEIFPEEYVDIDRADQPLGPLSGHHLNIITETDRTIEKWHIRISHNRDTFATFFKDYSTFKEFVGLLKGHMTKGIKKALGLIVKAVMSADPSKTIYDDKDFARIFGKTRINPVVSHSSNTVSELGKQYHILMQKLINKYYGKSIELWKNIQWYNPYHYSYENVFEEGRKDFIYSSGGANVDEAKRQMQEIYTGTHADGEDSDGEVTKSLNNLHRNDCLFALFDTINKALTVLTTEESSQYWLGNETSLSIYQTKAALDRAKKQQAQLDGHLPEQNPDGTFVHNTTTASEADSFEVTANLDNLVLLLNPEDYADLKTGVARRGQMDVRAVNLDMLSLNKIYPMRSMKPGYARLIDKRAFKIRSYFQMTDIQTPMEKLTWRYKQFFQFAITMFKNFAGCLFVPTPHFKASPIFYDHYALIGQTIEKKK